MEIEEATSMKIAADYLYGDINGLTLLNHLEEIAGMFAPNYNNENSTSVSIAVGRIEMMQTLRNIKRLTAEQIVTLSEGQPR